jgi:hypothetical protein
MSRIVNDVFVGVRDILQDAAGGRYLDADLLRYINDAMLEARSVRPDLFVRRFGQPLVVVTDKGNDFPLPDQFYPAVVFYVAGRAEMRDDEYAVAGRAQALVETYRAKLVGG